MPTSGSSDFNLDAAKIITQAYRKCGKTISGQALSTAALDEGRERLNTIINDFQNKGVFPWTFEEHWQGFRASTFILGSDGNTYECLLSHTSAAANQPVTGADWPRYWVRLGTGGVAWASGQSYVSSGDYAAAADTLGLWTARVRDANGSDYPVKITDRLGIESSPWSWATDRATHPYLVALDPVLGAPKLYIRPLPQDTTVGLLYTRFKRLQDFDANTNDPDAPARWLRTLVYSLASDLADDLHLPLEERIWLDKKARECFASAHQGDRALNEDENCFVEPYLSL